MTALCGLFSVAGLVAVKDALAGIGTLGRIMVALLYLSALGVAAAALINGYTAAYGWPTEVETTTIGKVRAYDRIRREQAGGTARRLRRAVLLSSIALGLLSVMVLILWLLPRGGPTVTPPSSPPATSAPAILPSP
ncbi:hypothetical protein GCM10010439_47360 [Actinocorallia aurantiaca]|uniref:Integral membrane protein n=1 Tax=Actinocorallia aurantiaca TaxID=46204 RepID=A0ABP6GVY4_9ACTN